MHRGELGAEQKDRFVGGGVPGIRGAGRMRKAPTVAIAGALAAPLAAQAVDFTISSHVNRALFVTDSDTGTKAEVKNNGGSSTRVRANGSSELMDGNTVAIQFKYEESGSGVNLRHANVQYGGQFGKHQNPWGQTAKPSSV